MAIAGSQYTTLQHSLKTINELGPSGSSRDLSEPGLVAECLGFDDVDGLETSSPKSDDLEAAAHWAGRCCQYSGNFFFVSRVPAGLKSVFLIWLYALSEQRRLL